MPVDRTVAIAGVVDIANFGDQLFPLIAQHRLNPHGFNVVAVAPTDVSRVLPDALVPRSLDWLVDTEQAIDGVIIGGGNIIYNLRVDYLADPASSTSWLGGGLHSSVWLGAAMAAAIRDIPFAFNAPGVPYPFSKRVRDEVLRPVLKAADYTGVRDQDSAILLRDCDTEISVVPDTVLELASMWPRSALEPTFRDLSARKGLDGRPYMAVNFRRTANAAREIDESARAIAATCEACGLVPLLVSVGSDLGDDAMTRALATRLPTAIALDDPGSLREIAAAIAFSEVYVGCSMHGYVAAAAYRVPGVIVALQPHRKLSGLLEWLGRPDDLARNMGSACEKAAARLPHRRTTDLPEAIADGLDKHWKAVRAMLDTPTRRAGERAAMLRALVKRAVIATKGSSWVLDPVTARRRA